MDGTRPTLPDFDAATALWMSLPFAAIALLAIPYTIWMRRKRRRARRAAMGGPVGALAADEPLETKQDRPSDDPYLWARLLVAFVVCAGLAWLCYQVLPRIGFDVPWWVPVLCFGVILAATLAHRGAEKRATESDENDGDHPDIAGRIGTDRRPDDPP